MRILCIKAAAGGVFLSLFHATAQASALPHDMSPLGMFFAVGEMTGRPLDLKYLLLVR